MEMKCAGEIMIPLESFPYIPYWFTLRQALAEVEDAETRQPSDKRLPWMILVFSEKNQLLGIVRRQEILQGLRPSLPGKLRSHHPDLSDLTADLDLYRLEFSAPKAIAELRNQIERPIIEFMSPIQATLEYDDYALLAIYLMVDRGLSFVPVIKNRQIVGIVYAEDALQEGVKHLV
jgi:CBS-domain-containing membrane protein